MRPATVLRIVLGAALLSAGSACANLETLTLSECGGAAVTASPERMESLIAVVGGVADAYSLYRSSGESWERLRRELSDSDVTDNVIYAEWMSTIDTKPVFNGSILVRVVTRKSDSRPVVMLVDKSGIREEYLGKLRSSIQAALAKRWPDCVVVEGGRVQDPLETFGR
jgi:hypothetical protein